MIQRESVTCPERTCFKKPSDGFHGVADSMRRSAEFRRRSVVIRMRITVLLALMILSPVLVLADVQWRDFGTTGATDTISLGRVTITVEAQKTPNAAFPGDDLIITVRTPGRKPSRFYFTSAYGYGSVAVNGHILLLKYGVGRGTWARVDHVKALRLEHDLDELIDVQSSYYVLTNPHNAAPDLFEYQLKIQSADGYTTLRFWLPKPQKDIPSEKIVKVKNGG